MKNLCDVITQAAIFLGREDLVCEIETLTKQSAQTENQQQGGTQPENQGGNQTESQNGTQPVGLSEEQGGDQTDNSNEGQNETTSGSQEGNQTGSQDETPSGNQDPSGTQTDNQDGTPSESQDETQTPAKSPELTLLLDCAHIALMELAEDYFPLTSCESVSTDAYCRVFLSEFIRTPLRILEVKDSEGHSQTFRVFDNFIKLSRPLETMEITYSYLPAKPTLGQPVELSPDASARILTYGICSHFCLCSMLFDEASMWDARYKDAISSARLRRDSGKIWRN